MSEPVLHLRPGRESVLQRRHPWIFSGAIASVEGDPQPGETVQVMTAGGEPGGWAAFSPTSQIRARMWTWDPDQRVDAALMAARIGRALEHRREWVDPETTNAFRVVYAESDGIPGFIADRYGDVLVVQFLSAGAERWRDVLIEKLAEQAASALVYERSDAEVRRLEGLPERAGPVLGDPPERVRVYENGLDFEVDLRAGHKTGFYLDQRENRRLLRGLAAGKRVLDAFSYTGGFTLAALRGNAQEVTAIDSSPVALALARSNLALNDLPTDRAHFTQGDVFSVLRTYRDEARRFELIVLDPPKFAPTASQAARAARGYKDINLLAFKLLAPGGHLVTFSCSGGISPDLFQKIVAGAALDAETDARIVHRLEQAPDHPVALNFPESAYLKGLVCRVGR